MTFILRIYRGTPDNQYWEEFELPLQPYINVNSALLEIQKRPINRKGEKVAPVVWEQGCLEEVCGSCSMLINGRPRQGCTALIEDYIQKPAAARSPSLLLRNTPSSAISSSTALACLPICKKCAPGSMRRIRSTEGEGPRIAPDLQDMMYTLSTLHDLWLLHRIVSPSESKIEVPRPGYRFPGAPLQRTPNRKAPKGQKAPAYARRRGDFRLRQCPKLRPSVPQRDPPHGIARRHRRRSRGQGAARLLPHA